MKCRNPIMQWMENLIFQKKSIHFVKNLEYDLSKTENLEIYYKGLLSQQQFSGVAIYCWSEISFHGENILDDLCNFFMVGIFSADQRLYGILFHELSKYGSAKYASTRCFAFSFSRCLWDGIFKRDLWKFGDYDWRVRYILKILLILRYFL